MKRNLTLKRLSRPNHGHRKIRMYPSITEIPRHLRHQHIYLLLPPSGRPREQRQTKSLQPIQDINLIPPAQLLHKGVLRPSIRRPHKHLLLNVDEARLAHPRDVEVGAVASHRPAALTRRLAQ